MREASRPRRYFFQTGYLTVLNSEDDGADCHYRPGYPNHEVRQSLNRTLLVAMVQNWRLDPAVRQRSLEQFGAADFTGLEQTLRGLWAGIPHDRHRRNEIARYEGFYSSVVCSCYTGLGLGVTVEDSSSAGRLDMRVNAFDQVWVLEFMVQERAGTAAAMAQLKDRGHADKYRHLDCSVYLVGVEFSEGARNLASREVEPV